MQLLSQTPVHPAESISTALGRLSPTCRALWSTQWPAQKRRAALAGDEEAAQEVLSSPLLGVLAWVLCLFKCLRKACIPAGAW